MAEDEDAGDGEVFCSDIIDLSGIDLTRVSGLPDSVLRSAISRVLGELAANSGASSSFQSSLPSLHSEDEGLAADEGMMIQN
jgi:FXSXX-COOH protein